MMPLSQKSEQVERDRLDIFRILTFVCISTPRYFFSFFFFFEIVLEEKNCRTTKEGGLLFIEAIEKEESF